jgi:hypothetical protein
LKVVLVFSSEEKEFVSFFKERRKRREREIASSPFAFARGEVRMKKDFIITSLFIICFDDKRDYGFTLFFFLLFFIEYKKTRFYFGLFSFALLCFAFIVLLYFALYQK